MNYIRAVQRSDVHQASLLLSGILWEIGSGSSVVQSAYNDLIFASLARVPRTPIAEDLLLAMQEVDQEAYQGAFACPILNAAAKRGLPLESGLICQAP